MKSLLKAVAVLALGAGACGELPAESNVVDLRVLAVKYDPPGFLVDPDHPEMGTDADWKATITALVVDPSGAGMELQVTNAVGCPDYIDVITAASQQAQATKLCPPADATSNLPPDVASLLMTQPIAPPEPNPVPPTGDGDFQWTPSVSFGLTHDQIAAFFAKDTSMDPAAVAKSIELNRQFGLAAIVNLGFAVNGQSVEAIKRVVYWPRLGYDGEHVNTNPTLGDPADPTVPQIHFYKHRDETTGNPDQPWPDDMTPRVSISAGDKLYVEPNYLPSAIDSYQIRILNTTTQQYETKIVDKELLRFQFYATAGKFDPEMQFSELSPILVGGMLHTDSEYVLPKDVPGPGAIVTIWLVTHDERAGSDWATRTIIVDP